MLARIRALLDESLATTAPSGLPGKALNYLAGQWPKLNRYAENETWPIDNNACENAIRPFVVGRRAWLFADTTGAAKASANLYSLVETCKANGVDAYRYLTELFKALPYARSADDCEGCCRGSWGSVTAAQRLNSRHRPRARSIDRLPFRDYG